MSLKNEEAETAARGGNGGHKQVSSKISKVMAAKEIPLSDYMSSKKEEVETAARGGNGGHSHVSSEKVEARTAARGGDGAPH